MLPSFHFISEMSMQNLTPIGLYLQFSHNVDFLQVLALYQVLFTYTAIPVGVRGGCLGGAEDDSPNKACGTDELALIL